MLDCNKVDYFKIDLRTIHQIERFEVQNSKKNSEEGLTEPSSQTPPPALYRASPSIRA